MNKKEQNMSYVMVKSGSYRNKPVKNLVFPLIKNMTQGKKGMFLTVDGTQVFGPDFSKIRVTVKPNSFEFVELPPIDMRKVDNSIDKNGSATTVIDGSSTNGFNEYMSDVPIALGFSDI